ncbi:Cullin [Cladochytrium replicatum]|nr:Cullin [Cladochytrium replicatum]
MSLRPKSINFDHVWAILSEDLRNMFNLTGKRVSGADMYQQVYDLCVAFPKPHTDTLFCALGDFFGEQTTEISRRILANENVVMAYAEEWNKYRTAAGYTDLICQYLNNLLARSPVSKNIGRYKRQSVESLAYALWKEKVLLEFKSNQGNKIVRQLLDSVKQHRDGEEIPGLQVHTVIDSFVELNRRTDKPLLLYITEFEKPYILYTKRYYEFESSLAISELDISNFMKKADKRLTEEMERCVAYCHSSSHEKIIKECESLYIAAHQNRINSQFEEMISQEKYDDCRLAYLLLSRIPDGVAPLLQTFENFIKGVGKEVAARLSGNSSKDPREYIETLIGLHAKYSELNMKIFQSDTLFLKALDQAFGGILNDQDVLQHTNSPEVLARYTDVLLKKPTKAALEADVDEKLSKVIVLFKYIDDKDIFQKFYSRLLAKRLIFGTSLSDDAESGMISRLKAACGVEYTSKLQRMFTDVAVSHDLQKRFRTSMESRGAKMSVDFSVMVLTAGSWPLSASSQDFQLPVELESSILHFGQFYMNVHSGRKVSWLYHLCKADLRVNYLDKKYELNVSLYQLAVLLAFNTSSSLQLRDIKEQTQLSEGEMIRIVKTLVDAKLFEPVDSLSIDSWVKLNESFSSKRTKIKISSALQMDTQQETEQARKTVDEDRKLYVQAAIVRIMKARKQLGHAALVHEVVGQTKGLFSPSVSLIKKSIESLIEKQYLERAQNQRDHYIYIS